MRLLVDWYNNWLNTCSYENPKYNCKPSKEEVVKLLIALHNYQNGNKQRKVVRFCKRDRPLGNIITNIRFLGWCWWWGEPILDAIFDLKIPKCCQFIIWILNAIPADGVLISRWIIAKTIKDNLKEIFIKESVYFSVSLSVTCNISYYNYSLYF